MDRSVLARKPMTELKDIASHLDMRGYQKLRKAELIDAIISSGTDGDGGGGGGAGQQRLVADDQPSPQASADASQAGETAEARERRVAREESARKVLPPSARQDGGAQDSGSGGVSGPDGSSDEGSDDAAPRSRDGSGEQRTERTRGDRPQRTRSRQEARAGGDAGGRDGEAQGDGEGGGGDDAGAQGDQRGGGPRGARDQQRDAQQDPGRNGDARDASRDADDDDDDDDDDSAAGRKRRNRRDRRKRNRDRQGGEETPAPTAPPSGNDPGEVRAGVLDILPEGYGFLRTTGYLPGERDVYVSQGQIRKHLLRRGDVVQGPIRQQRSNEKVPALHHVQRVNGDELADGQVADRPDFDELTAIHSEERLPLATDGPASTTARLVDLIAPFGRGQRALVIAPPRSGKSAVLRDLAQALADASPDSHLMAVLVDERPEEITEMAAVIPGEVIASTFDRPAEDHTQIAELAIERARRLVELGHDVIVLLDSVTRLARAYGVTTQSTGRTIAPGVEAASLYGAKRFLAAARNTEEGGSLTVIATALADTTSAHDDVILEEVIRVANTVVHLDATLASRRVHPPISVLLSGTDNESALQDDGELVIIQSMRRALEGLSGDGATELVLDRMATTSSPDDLLAQIRDARR